MTLGVLLIDSTTVSNSRNSKYSLFSHRNDRCFYCTQIIRNYDQFEISKLQTTLVSLKRLGDFVTCIRKG